MLKNCELVSGMSAVLPIARAGRPEILRFQTHRRFMRESIVWTLENINATVAEETVMTLGTILLIILILLLVGALPTWPHSRSWGYGPTGGIGLVLVILLILVVLGVV